MGQLVLSQTLNWASACPIILYSPRLWMAKKKAIMCMEHSAALWACSSCGLSKFLEEIQLSCQIGLGLIRAGIWGREGREEEGRKNAIIPLDLMLKQWHFKGNGAGSCQSIVMSYSEAEAPQWRSLCWKQSGNILASLLLSLFVYIHSSLLALTCSVSTMQPQGRCCPEPPRALCKSMYFLPAAAELGPITMKIHPYSKENLTKIYK